MKSKQKLMAELLTDRRLDSKFIETYCSIYEEYCKSGDKELDNSRVLNYSGSQLSALFDFSKCYRDKNGVSFSMAFDAALEVFSTLFNESQIRVATEYLGKIPFKTMHRYIDYNIPYANMHYIFLGLSENIDLTPYIKYAPDQINEIYLGLMQGLDVSKYAKKEFKPEVMGFIRHALVMNLPEKEVDYIVSRFS